MVSSHSPKSSRASPLVHPNLQKLFHLLFYQNWIQSPPYCNKLNHKSLEWNRLCQFTCSSDISLQQITGVKRLTLWIELRTLNSTKTIWIRSTIPDNFSHTVLAFYLFFFLRLYFGLFVTPWVVAYQAPPSMGFSRQEYWSRLPFPSPRDLPNPGIEPRSPALQAATLPSQPPGVSIF